MEISQKLLCFLFLVSFACGVALGGVYDLLYLSRLLIGLPRRPSPTEEDRPPKKRARPTTVCGQILLFAEDLFFALLCGVCLLLILYFINDGVFRFWAPLGMACGFFVYRVTLGRLVTALAQVLVTLLRRCIRFLVTCLLFPFSWLRRFLLRRVLTPIGTAFRAYRLRRRLEATEKQIKTFRDQASRGFDHRAE